MTFSLPSTLCLLMLPTDTALRTANWPRLNMTNHMNCHRRSALYGAGITGAYFLLIFNTHISFQSCNWRSIIDILPDNIFWNSYIQQHSSYFLHVVRSIVASGGASLTIADALLQKQYYLWFIAVVRLVFFHVVRAGAYSHKIHDIYACAFAVQTKYSVISSGFLFRRLLWRF